MTVSMNLSSKRGLKEERAFHRSLHFSIRCINVVGADTGLHCIFCTFLHSALPVFVFRFSFSRIRCFVALSTTARVASEDRGRMKNKTARFCLVSFQA